MHGAEFINSLAIIKCIIKIIAENGKFQRPVSPLAVYESAAGSFLHRSVWF